MPNPTYQELQAERQNLADAYESAVSKTIADYNPKKDKGQILPSIIFGVKLLGKPDLLIPLFNKKILKLQDPESSKLFDNIIENSLIKDNIEVIAFQLKPELLKEYTTRARNLVRQLDFSSPEFVIPRLNDKKLSIDNPAVQAGMIKYICNVPHNNDFADNVVANITNIYSKLNPELKQKFLAQTIETWGQPKYGVMFGTLLNSKFLDINDTKVRETFFNIIDQSIQDKDNIHIILNPEVQKLYVAYAIHSPKTRDKPEVLIHLFDDKTLDINHQGIRPTFDKIVNNAIKNGNVLELGEKFNNPNIKLAFVNSTVEVVKSHIKSGNEKALIPLFNSNSFNMDHPDIKSAFNSLVQKAVNNNEVNALSEKLNPKFKKLFLDKASSINNVKHEFDVDKFLKKSQNANRTSEYESPNYNLPRNIKPGPKRQNTR